MARYSAEISQAVRDGGAPNAAPIGTSATEMIDEFTGFRTLPSIIGARSRRSNPSGGRSAPAPRRRSEPATWVSTELIGIAVPAARSLPVLVPFRPSRPCPPR
ncbi:hypothetical protein [Actinomadura sp. NPDC048394]|uniref:hypothetical protein n=1 Tax=Actinomadura sp. NPDC048394 TaxID=3158223 RepID=UPI0033C1615F